MTVRALTVALRVDAGEMDPGFKTALAKSQAFKAQLEKASADVSSARSAYSTAQKSGGDTGAAKAALDNARMHRAEIVTRAKLEEDYFRQTHTALEVQLRDRMAYYAQLRAAHAGNTNMLLSIDRNYRMEVGKLNAQIAAEQGAGEAGGAAGGGVNWKKMLGRHGAGGFLRHGLSAAGMAGVGGELASPLMMMGYMGVAAGGAMAGVLLVANAYRDAQENAKKLVEIEQSYSKAIRDANKALADRAPLTARGQRSQQAFDILQAEIDKQRDIAHAADKEIKSYGGWFHPVEGITGMLGGTTQLDIRLEAMKKAADLQGRQVKLAKEIEASEKEEAWRAKIRAGYALDDAKAAGMKEGADKRRFELEVRQSKELFEIRMHMRDHPLAGDLEAPAQKRFTQERKNLDAQIFREAQERQVEAEGAMEDATIRLRYRGYEREERLLKEKQKRERELALSHGEDMTAIEVRQQAEKLDLATKRQEAKEATARQIANIREQAAVANGTMTQWEAQRRQLERDNPDMDAKQREHLVAAQETLHFAQKAKAIRDQQLTPIERWKKFRDEVGEMEKREQLTPAEAGKALKDEMARLMGKQKGGEFMDAVSYAQRIQSALFTNPLDHPLTAKDIQQMQNDIAALVKQWGSGIVLKRGG